MKGKKLIFGLYKLLQYVLYVNLVLAGGVIGFQIINFFRPEKSLLANYLGKFAIELKAVGILESARGTELGIYFESLTGNPQLSINASMHAAFVFIFTLLIVGITLFYNHQLYKLFENLNTSVRTGSPFSTKITNQLKSIALFSLAVFALGSLLSVLKLLLIDKIVFSTFAAHPVFDNQLLNFLWLALVTYILNEVYKVGIDLKKEQDLTI